MSIEAKIFSVLSESAVNALVAERIKPTIGTTGLQAPNVQFTAVAAESSTRLDGSNSGLEKYTLTVETYGIKQNQVTTIMNAVKSALHGYRGGQIHYSKQDDAGTEKLDDSEHYKGTQSFSVWYSGGNDIPIVIGADSYSLTVCGQTLTIDCNGIRYTGDVLLG